MSANDSLIGKQLGDYTVQELLGQGGMARVYRGYDPNLDRYAAIKVIESQLVASDDVEEYRERFQREARAIAKLKHARVVNVYQYGQKEEENLYYMAMDFIEGQDLRLILKALGKQGKYLTYAQIMRIMRDVADALDYSHQQGVIHRDIKPSNIMVTKDGHAVITDFGLALNAQEGTIGNTFGSVHYIAPEQAVNSAEAVPQSDIYSLGVVLYEMLTGRVPFEDVSAMTVALKHISDPPPPPSTVNPRITAEVEDVVLKCLEKNPQSRYHTGLELVHALQAAFAAIEDDETHELDASESSKPAPFMVDFDADSDPQPMIPPGVERQEATIDPKSGKSDPERPGSLPFSPLPTDYKPPQPETSGGRGPVIAGVALMVIVIGVVVALLVSGALGGGENGDDEESLAGGTQTAAAVAVAVTEETTEEPAPTRTDPPTGTPTGEPAAESTDEPTDSAAMGGAETTAEVTTEVTAELTAESEPDETVEPVPSNTVSPTATPTADATATPAPTETTASTPTPDASPTLRLTIEPDEPEVLLRYDGRTLVLYNRAPEGTRVNVSNLSFVRVLPDGAETTFRASEWDTTALRVLESQECFQVWTVSYRSLPADEFPADICRPMGRQGFRQTSRSFWVSTNPEAIFEVRQDGEVLATCETTRREDANEMRCLVDLE